ncbi:M15 family metallopeptidase [Nocardioides sp.]|uniref:M15 family metallopeptidase n=1 Tax=Nocardioides sp. TaxID=35761 RepID=UPI003518B4C3
MPLGSQPPLAPARRRRVVSSGRGGALLATVVSLVAAVFAVVAPASAAPAPTVLALSAPVQFAGQSTTLGVVLTDGGQPVAGAAVTVERWNGSAWAPLTTAGPGGVGTTDAAGSLDVEVVVDRDPARNRVRATFAGDADHAASTTEYTLPLRQRPTRTWLGGPTRVVDEQVLSLALLRRTSTGVGVPGPVTLQRWNGSAWVRVLTANAGSDGRVVVRVRPRTDTRFRAVSSPVPWALGSVSTMLRVDNVPAARPVVLPARSPRPRALPAQARATTPGADARITTIPDSVWRSMVGRSWRPGCLARSSLRLLRINYWDFSGYRRRGELVAAANAIGQMARALTDMYNAKLPIRSMYRVDRFGYSSRVRGGDDYASMAADNTSAFNCRWVVGRPGVMSPHASGRALDINPWENPFRSSHGWTPNGWWPAHSNPRYAWRSSNHAVVRIMARHGLRWTYGVSDSQHFDTAVRRGRVMAPPSCGLPVCH